ncbi:glycosyltransferase family 2 protein [Elioraea tepidiphila]|uniref:glycosyltransferase family 2 protein n=1 Tax=Elioraea tepidiphila TaxID=457934 RepID=UPI0009FD3E9E|nr:glycosyltransferase family A protein [Elioraea tepidiphila]
MPQVTVAMPIYNAEKYLESAIKNIQRQSLSDFEFIISDNASTDSTEKIVRKLAAQDSRIRYYRHSHNMGAIDNFAFVANKVNTPFVVLAAHDDRWSDNYIEALYLEARNCDESEIVVPTVVLEHENGEIYKEIRFDDRILTMRGSEKARALLMNATGSWFYGMYKKNALKRALNEVITYNYVWAGDLVALTPFMLNGTVSSASAAVFYHRETGVSRQAYRPVTFSERRDVYCAFAKMTIRSLRRSRLSTQEKLLMLPYLVGYVGKHSCKLRRIIRTVLFPKSAERAASRKLTIR